MSILGNCDSLAAPLWSFFWRIEKVIARPKADEFLYRRQKPLQTRDGGKDSSKKSSSEIINYTGYEILMTTTTTYLISVSL